MRRFVASRIHLLGTSNSSKPDSSLADLPAEERPSSTPDVVAVAAAGESIPRWRPLLAALTTCLGLTLFCLTLSRVDAGMHALPWYVTMGLLTALCLRVIRTRAWLSDDAVHITGFRNREPLSILEALAFSYLCAATILYVFACLSVCLPKKPPILSRHVVDIEFTSLTDKVDHEEILPGENVAEPTRKRTGDLVTVQGSLEPHPAKVTVAGRQDETRVVRKQDDFKKPQEAARQLAPPAVPIAPRLATWLTPASGEPPAKPLPLPASWATQVVRNLPLQPINARKDKNAPFFEEVKPPELVEMVDNDGSTESTRICQVGGRSAGGSGARADLNTYLRQLHKKIKTAWTPPRGQSRRAEILFRIGKPGKLVSIKLIKTSGDNENDEAAMQAATAAVKGQGDLPVSYELPWLDVIYTFNYTAEELHEIPGSPPIK
jgi:hypothetical protein